MKANTDTLSIFEDDRPKVSVSENIQYLSQYVNYDKIPIIGNKDFERITNEIGVQQFRKDLSQFIFEVRPPYPTQKITKQSVAKCFHTLRDINTNIYCTPKENIDKPIVEKHEDYTYPFDEYGQGIINAPATYNDISNYYHQLLRLSTPSKRGEGVANIWTQGTAHDIWGCIKACWGGINRMKEIEVDGKKIRVGGELSEDSYRSTFRLGHFIATQFKPNVAKTVYTMTKAKTVLDTSCGWGDRLAGFYTSKAESYTGCDPNPETFKNYIKQVIDYESFLGNFKPDITIKEDYFSCNGVKQVKIYRCGAENLPWHDIKNIDCVFTSPPYFSTEHYNKGGLHEEDQSWFKFDTSDKWLNDFFLPVSENSFNSLSDNGHLLLNIIDPTIKGKRYKVCDVLVDTLYKYFNGTMGMTMSQRPDSRTDEQRENSKTKLNKKLGLFDRQKQLKSHYIENIWCFSKNKYDYFSLYKEEKDIQKDLF